MRLHFSSQSNADVPPDAEASGSAPAPGVAPGTAPGMGAAGSAGAAANTREAPGARLADSGVHPNVAKSLARHSTISVTMDRYSHADNEAEVAAVSKLPIIDGSAAETVEGAESGADALGVVLGVSGTTLGDCKGPDETTPRRRAPQQSFRKYLVLHGFRKENGEGGIRTRGDENTRHAGLANRCLQPLGHLSRIMHAAYGVCLPLSGNADDRTRTCNLGLMNPSL